MADPGFEQLRKLTEISRALTYTTSLDQVTRLTVERGAELLDAAATVLMLPDTEGLLHVRAAQGVREDVLARFTSPTTDELIARLQGLFGVPDDCFVAVPFVVGGEVTGLIAVALRQPSTPADEWLLSALADHTAVALENARLGGAARLEVEDRLRVRAAITAKDRALSTLAHDIRTPLGSIQGYCELLEGEIYGPINDKQRQALSRVRLSGRHLLSLLDNVMNMARLNGGVVQVALEPVRLDDVAREAVDMLVPAAEAKAQKLSYGKLANATVMADVGHVRQVLVNLIGNAVKFTPEQGAIEVATVERTIDGVRWAEARVSDTGPGVIEAEQAAIFEPFYRSEVTNASPGVGLGLAIARALVHQMGGELELDNESTVGSTFVLRLRIVEQT